jgi:hypothetical protein
MNLDRWTRDSIYDTGPLDNVARQRPKTARQTNESKGHFFTFTKPPPVGFIFHNGFIQRIYVLSTSQSRGKLILKGKL